MIPLQILKASPLFHGWNENDLRTIAAFASARALSPGESLFVEGEDSSALYIMGSGTIAIRKTRADGEEASVTTIGTGSHFGEMGMLAVGGAGTAKRSAMAEAVEASQILELDYAKLEGLFAGEPRLGYIFFRKLAASLAGRIRQTTSDLAGLQALHLRHV
jgi:CRP/FNR family cyclic AMP-dependent transcriptional regulator